MDLKRSRITVTGGSGFLGTHVVEELRSRGCAEIFVPRKADFDLVRRDDLVVAVQRHLRGTHKDLLGRMTTLLKERIGAVQQKRATNMSGKRPAYQLWSVRNHERWAAEGMAKRIDAYVAHQRMLRTIAGFEGDEVA